MRTRLGHRFEQQPSRQARAGESTHSAGRRCLRSPPCTRKSRTCGCTCPEKSTRPSGARCLVRWPRPPTRCQMDSGLTGGGGGGRTPHRGTTKCGSCAQSTFACSKEGGGGGGVRAGEGHVTEGGRALALRPQHASEGYSRREQSPPIHGSQHVHAFWEPHSPWPLQKLGQCAVAAATSVSSTTVVKPGIAHQKRVALCWARHGMWEEGGGGDVEVGPTRTATAPCARPPWSRTSVPGLQARGSASTGCGWIVRQPGHHCLPRTGRLRRKTPAEQRACPARSPPPLAFTPGALA
jgi:hypothetical protein